jgi:hypothetical protein
MIQEGMRASARLAWLVETHVRPMYDAVRAMIEAAQREGMAPIGRPEHLHYMLIGAASSAYALSAEFELLTGTPANRRRSSPSTSPRSSGCSSRTTRSNIMAARE